MGNRNITLDYLRFFLSFFIVIIHSGQFLVEIPSVSYFINDGLARVALPLFFVISGYCMNSAINDKIKFERYLKKMFTLYVVWMILYCSIGSKIFPDESYMFPRWFRFFFVAFTGAKHLWYVAALLSASILLYYLNRCRISNLSIFWIALTLGLVGWLITRLQLVNLNVPIYMLTHNVIFNGFYYVLVGYLIKRNNLVHRFEVNNIIILFIGLLILFFGEVYFLYIRKISSDIFISFFALIPLIFVLVQKKSKVKPSDGFIAELSAGVYFVHYMVIDLLSSFNDLKIEYLFGLSHGTGSVVISYFFSMLIATILIKLNKHIKIFL